MTTVLASADAEILTSVYAHRLLAARQVQELHAAPHLRDAGKPRWAQHRLAGLRTRGYVEVIKARPPNGQWLWFTTPAGAEAVEAGDVDIRKYRMTAERAAGDGQAHLLATNDVGLVFVRVAREHGHDFGPLDWSNEVAHRLPPGSGLRSPLIASDAVLHYTYRQDDQDAYLVRFIELDRGSYGTHRLLAKIRAYATLATSDTWKAQYLAFPKLMVVMAGKPEPALRRRIELTVGLCDEAPDIDASGLSVSFCTLVELQERGPFRHVFRALGQDQSVDLLGRVHLRSLGKGT